MNLPHKINPDRIIDSIVEVKYDASFPYEILLGKIFNQLDETYFYTNQPIIKNRLPVNIPVVKEINLQLGRVNIFVHNNISIEMKPNSFIFNCLDSYIGWPEFFNEIKNALNQISKSGTIDKWTRVGVRYVSQYLNTDLHDCLKFNYNLGIPEIKASSMTFKNEFLYENCQVILNLVNKNPVAFFEADGSEINHFFSFVDVDVIKDKIDITNIDDLFNQVDTNHSVEKKIYFGLLTEKYLETLKPQY
jgi:uncharacterized protein (TIGR04255 family)